MASSSSSSSTRPPIKHQVFLSFRGSDTRDNFTSHLDAALRRQGIITFLDDRLDKGEKIEPIILKAIEESLISVIIFSQNFATSPWCLDELVKILDCKKRWGQQIVPVFYHVDPANIENRTEIKVDKWSLALKEAAYLSGFVSDNIRPDSVLVEEIVKDVLKKLRHFESSHECEYAGLVGMESKLAEMDSLLCMGGDDIRVIGIWGMGGIGKTTLARFVFERFSYLFEGNYFLENVREKSEKYGLNQVKRELLEGILDERYMQPRMNQLRYKKVLIVLDDVNKFDQVEYLAGKHDWFGVGSRIIIVSRDYKVFQDRADEFYLVKALCYREALRFFSLYAFKMDHPKRGYLELCRRVMDYCKGHPLALKVLGSTLYNADKDVWESQVHKLEKMPSVEVHNSFKISYDILDYHDQQIFLDIACFFKGETVSEVKELLDACGFSTLIGLKELERKCLIILSDKDKVEMHDLLQETGCEIVRQECIEEAGKRSRLWKHEDVCHVGSETVKGIFLDQCRQSWPPTVFANMPNIRFLKLYSSRDNNSGSLWLPEGLESLPNELRYMAWHRYPLKSLPSKFHSEKLVKLDMSHSRDVERLWDGVQDLPNLNSVNLNFCTKLMETPDFSKAPKLELIKCACCSSLEEVSPSISVLSNLHELDLSDCTNLISVPECPPSLKILTLYNSPKINTFPQVPNTIEILLLTYTAIEEIPASIGSFSRIKELSIHGCEKLKSLPNAVLQLNQLSTFGLCTRNFNLCEVMTHLTRLPHLIRLYLNGNNFEAIPPTIKRLSHLRELNLSNCRRLKRLPQLPSSLIRLIAISCVSLQKVPNSVRKLRNGLRFLNFSGGTSFDENQVKSMLLNSQLRIQHIAQEADAEKDPFSLILPGNRVPQWFGHQSIGDSITVPLPPNWIDNLLGFALCAVFRCDSRSWRIKVECQLKSVQGETYCMFTDVLFLRGTPENAADTIFVGYRTRVCPRDDIIGCREALFKFSILYTGRKPAPSSIFKKCGVHLLQKHSSDEPSDELFSSDEEDRNPSGSSPFLRKKKKKKKKKLANYLMRMKSSLFHSVLQLKNKTTKCFSRKRPSSPVQHLCFIRTKRQKNYKTLLRD